MKVIHTLRDFLALESAGGILLAMAAALAMVLANSPLDVLYSAFLDTPVEVRVGRLEIAKPLLLWINDGLMAIFFFMIGLELKREAMEGELSTPSQIVLPAIAALGGMLSPALIYIACNRGNPVALEGWAIPTATDIAFALGVLSLLGPRVPAGLKIFLLTLAILDDLGAIVVIALFYTANLSLVSLGIALCALAVLAAFNRFGVTRLAPYLLVGLILWVSVLKSGVHATLAGVALALLIPRTAAGDLEHDLHPSVAYAILPLFAFANAGVSLQGVSPASFLRSVPLGIALGLVAGKTIGVFLVSLIAIRLGWAKLPAGANWGALFGVSVLCGIGFTMSLFIAGLAFESGGNDLVVQTRLGIIGGSIVAAVLGLAILHAALPRSDAQAS